MLKGIVFDLDGTLIHSLPVTLDGFNFAIETLGEKKRSYTEIMSHFGLGEDKIFEKILGPHKAVEAYDIFKKYTQDHLPQIALHNEVSELLELIKTHRIPTSIVTGRSWQTTEVILKHHGLLDSFISIIAHDHVTRPKPSPEGIHLALDQMKLQPHEICYVGDSAVDILASHSAGAHSIAALWDDLVHLETLTHHQPHHCAQTPLQVWDIWKKLS